MADERYGCATFVGDVVLLICTGGLWGIWMIIREIRRGRR